MVILELKLVFPSIPMLNLLLLAYSCAGFAQSNYSVHDLGHLGGEHSVVYAINDAGHATGFSVTSHGGDKAFFWDGVSMLNLGTWGRSSWGFDLNWKDEIVGTWEIGQRGFHWANGTLTKIEPGYSSSTASGINAKGIVSGSADIHGSPFPEMRGYVRQTDGSITLLDPAGGTHSQAIGGINLSGTVCGYSSAGGTVPRQAAIWPNSGSAQLLGGLHPSYSSRGYAINRENVVVGDAFISASEVRAYRWTPAQGMVEIFSPAHLSDFSSARDLNAAGTIVGYAEDWSLTPPSRAVRWDAMGRAEDLNNLIPAGSGWTLKKAYSINSLGEIGCTAERQGKTHAVILRPQLGHPVLSELCLPEAGVATALFALGFTANKMVALVASTSLGQTTYSGCPGIVLDLANPRLLMTRRADLEGRVRFDLTIPGRAAGALVYAQALEPAACRKSEVKQYQIL